MILKLKEANEQVRTCQERRKKEGGFIAQKLSVHEALVTPQTGSGQNTHTHVLPETAVEPPPAFYQDLKKQTVKLISQPISNLSTYGF